MSAIDSELSLLRQKLEALEEKKRLEAAKELERVENPMKVLHSIINDKKKAIEQNRYSKSVPLARFYDQEKVDMMEPIFNMLNLLQGRIEALEKK
jgi:hypothetical protein